jgi:anti-anti-sigma factor
VINEALSSAGREHPELIVVHEERDAAHVIHAFSDIDIFLAQEFEREIEKAKSAHRVVIDLSECRYVDSSVLSVLVRAKKMLGSKLRVVSPEGTPIRRILRMTALETFLPVVNGFTEALA